MNSTYSELLSDPRWQKKRLAIFTRDNWSCVDCGNTKENLHVHHTYYAKGKKPWEYPDSDLRTLCKSCHGREHGKSDGGNLDWKAVDEMQDEAIGVCISTTEFDSNGAMEKFELTYLLSTSKTDYGFDLYQCKNSAGSEVTGGSDFCIIKLKDGSESGRFSQWANDFRNQVSSFVH